MDNLGQEMCGFWLMMLLLGSGWDEDGGREGKRDVIDPLLSLVVYHVLIDEMLKH